MLQSGAGPSVMRAAMDLVLKPPEPVKPEAVAAVKAAFKAKAKAKAEAKAKPKTSKAKAMPKSEGRPKAKAKSAAPASYNSGELLNLWKTFSKEAFQQPEYKSLTPKSRRAAIAKAWHTHPQRIACISGLSKSELARRRFKLGKDQPPQASDIAPISH